MAHTKSPIEVWITSTFSAREAELMIREAREHGVTGRLTLHLSEGHIARVELCTRSTDPGFLSMATTQEDTVPK